MFPRGSHKLDGRAGLTLIEVMVSLAVSVTLFTLCLQVLQQTTRTLNGLEQNAQASDEAKRLNEFLLEAWMGVGGGMLRPWTSLRLEDDALGDGTDRITFAEQVDSTLQCAVESVSGETLVGDTSTGCCLTDVFSLRHTLLVSGTADNRAHWMLRRVTDLDLARCEATLEPAYTQVLDLAPASDAAWADGVLVVVRVQTLWLRSATDELMIDEDEDGDGEAETRIAADRVIDLQAALGYDVSPWDWRIRDTGNTQDEWLYNAPGDTFAANDGQGLATARLDELRMVRFGVIVGAPSGAQTPPEPVQLLNGPARSRPGWVLRPVLGVTGLRNYDIMR